MVMIALRKSPADVWVEVDWSGARKAIRRGMRFCCCSHCSRVSIMGSLIFITTYINNALAALTLLEADDL